jgi:hypothetical protein
MRSQDFLHKNAETPFNEDYIAAGAICRLLTNSAALLEAARASFLPSEEPSSAADFSLRFWVDESDAAQPPWPKPYLRGLGHLVFAGFDTQSSVLVDLGTRRMIGRFSAAMANESNYWTRVIFPMLLSIIAGSVGAVELHASCVAHDEQGLILMGPSRSGKSTLAMALSEAGFSVLSDDRTFCTVRQGRLQAYGLPRPLKLRREAANWFEEFRDREPTDIQNGERVFYCEPKPRTVEQRFSVCEPQALVFLERQERHCFRLTRMECDEVISRIEPDLLAEDRPAIQEQEKALESLLELPSWRLQYGGSPQDIARQIGATFLSRTELNDSEFQGRTQSRA